MPAAHVSHEVVESMRHLAAAPGNVMIVALGPYPVGRKVLLPMTMMVPTEIVEVSVVVFDGTGMIATTEIVEVRVLVACDDASELVVVGLETEERGFKGIRDDVDEEERIEKEDVKVEVDNGLELTVELDRLDVGVEVEVVVEGVDVVVENGVVLVTVIIGCGVGKA